MYDHGQIPARFWDQFKSLFQTAKKSQSGRSSIFLRDTTTNKHTCLHILGILVDVSLIFLHLRLHPKNLSVKNKNDCLQKKQFKTSQLIKAVLMFGKVLDRVG